MPAPSTLRATSSPWHAASGHPTLARATTERSDGSVPAAASRPAVGQRAKAARTSSWSRPLVEHTLPASACATPSSDGEPPAGLLHDDLHRGQVPQAHDGLDGHVERSLGHEHVHPEVAQAAGSPGSAAERDEGVTRAVVVERADVAVGAGGPPRASPRRTP